MERTGGGWLLDGRAGLAPLLLPFSPPPGLTERPLRRPHHPLPVFLTSPSPHPLDQPCRRSSRTTRSERLGCGTRSTSRTGRLVRPLVRPPARLAALILPAATDLLPPALLSLPLFLYSNR